MSKSILGLILPLFLAFTIKAEQPIFNISSATANPGEHVDINFVVDNFTNLVLAQFSVSWNPDVLDFVAIKNLNPSVPGLTAGSFNVETFVDEGEITMVWFEPSTNQVSIPDGSLFFTIEFEVIGAPCQSSTVSITNSPTDIQVAEDEENIGLISNTGVVTVPGTGCSEDLQLIGETVTAACGTETCISFTVQNFVDVASMEFALVYDPSVIEFVRIQDYAPLQSFGGGSTNLVSPGQIRVVWTSPNVANESLPDGTTLFEICFNVLGPGGTSSSITFGNNPPVVIADVNNDPHVVTIDPAVITAECAIEGHALIAESECTQPNEVTCIDISVNDFENILSMQFSINWNPSLFVFDHIEGLNLADLTSDAFATPPDIAEGQLSVSWFNINTATVPDLSSIFTLCLRAIGPAGSSSPITFTNTPAQIEIADEDSVLVFALVAGQADIMLNCGNCAISYTITPTAASCPGTSDGSLNLNLDTGTCTDTPSFLWSYQGRTTEDLIGVPAGTYTVTITVGTQIVVASGTVNDPLPIGVFASITHPTPANASNGAINITVTGGLPPYSFHWSTNSPSEDLSNIPSGTYTVTITDANGCTFVPDPFIVGGDLAAQVTHVSCAGGCDGSIALAPSFGCAPYSYTWNTVPVQTSPTIPNLCAGIYCVTITDCAGSTRDSCFTVSQPLPLSVSASVTPDVNENCHGAIDLNVLGCTNPFSYNWSTGATTQDIINLCPGQYCVTITCGANCTFDTCFSVGGNLNLSLNVTQHGNFQISCAGVCDGEIVSVVSGGTLPITYSWSNGSTSPNLTGLCAGIYSLTVTDASGNSATATRTITAPPQLSFTTLVTLPTDISASDGAISVIANGGVPPYTYQWTGPVTGTQSAMNNLPSGIYSITLTDANGCEFTNVIELLTIGTCYQANKIITPNSDGKNDFFIIQCAVGVNNHLSIFNRFGGLVYETDDYLNNWTGVDEDDQPLPDGGYLWVFMINNSTGAPQIVKGTVNVLRTAD
jgi:gliding motility-associated-like protein